MIKRGKSITTDLWKVRDVWGNTIILVAINLLTQNEQISRKNKI